MPSGSVDRDLKVKVLVLGDSGVGKSSFTHLICHNQPTKNAGYTIGCSVEIKLHDFKQGTLEEKTYCVELWDIGATKTHRNSRFVFYNNVCGIILVHDLTNNKSLQNLTRWLNSVLSCDPMNGLSSIKIAPTSGNVTPTPSEDIPPKTSIPLLMVGTKLDNVSESSRANVMTRGKVLCNKFGCDEIHMDTSDSRYVSAGSGNSVKLSRFFDETIEHAKQRRTVTSTTVGSGSSPAMIDARQRVFSENRQHQRISMDPLQRPKRFNFNGSPKVAMD